MEQNRCGSKIQIQVTRESENVFALREPTPTGSSRLTADSDASNFKIVKIRMSRPLMWYCELNGVPPHCSHTPRLPTNLGCTACPLLLQIRLARLRQPGQPTISTNGTLPTRTHFIAAGERLRALFLVLVVLTGLPLLEAQSRIQDKTFARIRFLNSATGVEVPPDSLVTNGVKLANAPIAGSGSVPAGTMFPPGSHSLKVVAVGFKTFVGAVTVPDDSVAATLRVWLDPEEPPPQLATEQLRSSRRPDSMHILGFIVNDVTGRPLPGVRVHASQGDRETASNAEGFFEFQLPVAATEGNIETELLSFEIPGYITQRRLGVELWRGGDWIFRVRLVPGTGESQMELPNRRNETEPVNPELPPAYRVPVREINPRHARLATPGNPPVRVPQTIRVQHAGNIDYLSLETYVKGVLPAEWLPSWGSLNGGKGKNSLRAGAVAIRTYAAGYVDAPTATVYDICSTTSCQVYDPTLQTTVCNQATDETAGDVMVNSSGRISFHLTEYSSENNALNLSCGDGSAGNAGSCLLDAVCGGLGQARNGHGRGLCQRGSARWASGWSRVLSNVGGPHAFGAQTWEWILGHYYPTLALVHGSSLGINDRVEVVVTGASDVASRACAGGGIDGGVNCGQVRRVANNVQGTIISGPEQITNDGRGHTWWKVRWTDDNKEGWTAENYLQRTHPILAATMVGNQIVVSWGKSLAGYILESATSLNTGESWDPVTLVPSVSDGVYAVTNRLSQSGLFYRLRHP